MSQPRKFWMRWRVRVGYPVAILYWILATPTPHWIAIGAVIAGLGLIVRAAASGQLRKNEELATSGIYSVTRNPLYLGSAILAAGFVMAGHSLWAGLLVGIYFCVFYYAVMRNEEDELRAKFGASFEKYACWRSSVFPKHFSRRKAACRRRDAERFFLGAVPAKSRI